MWIRPKGETTIKKNAPCTLPHRWCGNEYLLLDAENGTDKTWALSMATSESYMSGGLHIL